MLIFSYRLILSYEILLPAVLILHFIAIYYCILKTVSIVLLKSLSFLLVSFPIVKVKGKISFYACSACIFMIILICKYSLLVVKIDLHLLFLSFLGVILY